MTATTLTPIAEGRLARAVRLSLVHFRFQFIEILRTPIAVIGNLAFPAIALLFFVVPQAAVAQHPVAATSATAQLAAFAIASTCMFTFGLGVSEERSKPFAPYQRTLPVGALPPLAGRVLNGIVWSYIALVPLVVVGWLGTSAELDPARILPVLVTVIGIATPFTLLGLAIGYAMSPKAAVAVVQLTLFPLAFAGGMFMPPEIFPGWLDAMSSFTPTRAVREVFVATAAGTPLDAKFVLVLLGWIVLFATLATIAYRRDEGRNFR